jgi:hypothetical protein
MTDIISPYQPKGISSEQNLLEDLINESLYHRGTMFYYIPRTLIGKDDILGEDRLSEFKNAYPISMFFENIDSFGGQGAFIQKFGLMIEQSATLIVSKRNWNNLVGQYGQTILPNRPAEGDLLYFPLTDTLFSIMFVEHQNQFYQLGKLYVYRLQIETFVYGSEKIDTGISDIDEFETLRSYDVDNLIEIDGDSPIGESPYDPSYTETNADIPNNYGRNEKFKQESNGFIFDVDNPFGDVEF